MCVSLVKIHRKTLIRKWKGHLEGSFSADEQCSTALTSKKSRVGFPRYISKNFIFILEYSWFAMLLISGVQQSDSVIQI